MTDLENLERTAEGQNRLDALEMAIRLNLPTAADVLAAARLFLPFLDGSDVPDKEPESIAGQADRVGFFDEMRQAEPAVIAKGVGRTTTWRSDRGLE